MWRRRWGWWAPLEATYLSTNKSAMRAAFWRAGDPSPKSCLVERAEELEFLKLAYPLIVKPTDRSGSRGVTLIKQPGELRRAFEEARTASFEKKVVVEEFVAGKEYSVECVLEREALLPGGHPKYTTGAPHFVETAHLSRRCCRRARSAASSRWCFTRWIP